MSRPNSSPGPASQEVILRIHRGAEGFVGFARKPEGDLRRQEGKLVQFENLCSIQVAELTSVFPAIADWLTKDSYFTVNSYFRAAPYPNKLTGYQDVLRRENCLRYLNACYVDLDVGRPDSDSPEHRMTWRDAAAIAGNMMDAGLLPQASIFARSGRGVYLFWLLVDGENPSTPPPAFDRNIVLYKRLNKALGERLRDLAWDSSAHDAARVLRVPGTLHSKTGNRAEYNFQADASGRGFVYTMKQLADFLGVRITGPTLLNIESQLHPSALQEHPAGTAPCPPERVQYLRQPKNRGSAPNRVKGRQTRFARCARDIEKIEQWAGGWIKGTRTFRIRIFCDCLKAAGLPRNAIEDAATRMAANCRPPFPSDSNDQPVSKIVDLVLFRTRKYKAERLVEWFDVTPELARELALESIIPQEVALERKAPTGGLRGQEQQERRQFIIAHIGAHGLPKGGSRELARLLNLNGIRGSHQTVNKDLHDLGYVLKKPGRPSKDTPGQILMVETQE